MRGTLKKRSEHSWTIIVDIGRDPATGKRRQQWHTVRGSKREAEKRLAELLYQMDTGGYIKPLKLTLGEFLRQWLIGYASTNVRPRTYEGYKTVVEGQLIPSLGNTLLSELSPSHLQAHYTRCLLGGRRDGKKGGLSPRSVLHHHRILSEALSHAQKWSLVARNVAQSVDSPRAPSKEMCSLDEEGVHRLLREAEGTVYHPLIHLLVYTGLRRSEALGLRWQDVDLDLASLSVVQVMHHLRDGRNVFQEPKTARGKRMVALSPQAVLDLRTHRKQVEAERALLGSRIEREDLAFSHPDATPLLPDSVTHAFTKIARRAGLPGIRLHDLRHTHASLMLKQGTHPKIVSERLGHSSVAITLDTYSHVLPGIQAAAALRFDEGLDEGTIESVSNLAGVVTAG